MTKQIVAVNFRDSRTGKFDNRVYHYYCELPVMIGDLVLAPTVKGDSTVRVADINVPVYQVEARVLPLMKTIHAFAPDQEIPFAEEQITLEAPREALIIVKQLPIIEERLRSISEQVKARTQAALALPCTDNTVKEIKKIRADLAKDFNDLESRRKSVKKEVMAPYEKFEAVYKECVTNIFAPADTELKARIDSVESALKDEKRKEVESYYAEYAASKGIDFVGFDRAGITITLSANAKSLKTASASFLDRVAEDLVVIETQRNKEEVLVEYKKTLNISYAITTVTQRHEAIDAEKQRMEKQRAEAEERNARIEAVEAVAASVQAVEAPVVIEPRNDVPQTYKVMFLVIGRIDQLKALKEFLDKGGYQYESAK